MKIIVCLDDKNGMLFNERRQSTDRVLRERVLQLTAGTRLWMNAYSAKQFAEQNTAVTVDEDFLQKAAEGEYCFVENTDCTAYLSKAEAVVVYRWNTVYPSDVRFPVAFFVGKTPVSIVEFEGHSHKKITEELFEL